MADTLGDVVNRLLGPTGFMITRAAPSQAESWRERIGGPYRSDRGVIRKAAERGLSVGEYMEEEWGHRGRARTIVERMQQAGAVPDTLTTVCEIGPGSGRYIHQVLAIVRPHRYEIYEIERHRARWLARTYPVVMLPTPGERLAGTPDGSVQLVHAHGVFSSLKVLTCVAIFNEIARVTSSGGHVVFDIMTEECLSDDEIDAWLKTPLRYVNFMPRTFAVEFFEKRGFRLVDEFRHPLMIFGHSLYLVFKKTSA